MVPSTKWYQHVFGGPISVDSVKFSSLLRPPTSCNLLTWHAFHLVPEVLQTAQQVAEKSKTPLPLIATQNRQSMSTPSYRVAIGGSLFRSMPTGARIVYIRSGTR